MLRILAIDVASPPPKKNNILFDVFKIHHWQKIGRFQNTPLAKTLPPLDVVYLKMQLDVEESTPASDMTYSFPYRIAIGICLLAITSILCMI